MPSSSAAAVPDNDAGETDEVIHEKQSLQKCAVHTVNNLLQLSASTDEDNGWTCGSQQLNPSSWKQATKSEFDQVANDLTVAENNLMGSTSQEEEEASPSLMQVLSSRHRTPVMGNYSTEVIQTVLKTRDVDLSWYKVEDGQDILQVDDDDCIVIGFVVNAVKPKTMWTRLVGLIPGDLFGRHWYAITRLQRGQEQNDEGNTWKVVDSMVKEVEVLTSTEAVSEYLKSVVDKDGVVFRATTRLTPTQDS